MMEKRQVLIVGVCCLMFVCISASGATIPYSTDFSTNPGWVTDQAGNYAWDPTNELYHVVIENEAPAYQPNRVFGITFEHPLSSGSFELQWDVRMGSCGWSAGISFGVFDSHLLGAGLDDPKGTQSITTDFAIGDLGRVMALTVAGPEGPTKIHSGPGDFWEFDKWYRNILSYDKVGDKVDFKFLERETGKIIWDPDPLSVAGGDFTRELFFLGGSRYGMGDTGYDGTNRDAEFVGDIDNVNVIPEPATLLLLGLGGLLLRRRRR